MTFYCLGNEHHLALLKARFPDVPIVFFEEDLELDKNAIHVLWDFSGLSLEYSEFTNGMDFVFVNSVNYQILGQMAKLGNEKLAHLPIFGFNGWPSMFERSLLEVTCPDDTKVDFLKDFLETHKISYSIVLDRVGMVTPRIIAMIINEAYFTLQEGTSSKKDIDTSMKMGTNYPFGPFEWSEKIGLDNLVSLLDRLFLDTHDERYKVCPLLKTESFEVTVNGILAH